MKSLLKAHGIQMIILRKTNMYCVLLERIVTLEECKPYIENSEELRLYTQ